MTNHQSKDNRKNKVHLQEIRYTMHVVRDDFPVDYEGILGMDFLQKHKIKSDQKNYLQIDEIILKLHHIGK